MFFGPSQCEPGSQTAGQPSSPSHRDRTLRSRWVCPAEHFQPRHLGDLTVLPLIRFSSERFWGGEGVSTQLYTGHAGGNPSAEQGTGWLWWHLYHWPQIHRALTLCTAWVPSTAATGLSTQALEENLLSEKPFHEKFATWTPSDFCYPWVHYLDQLQQDWQPTPSNLRCSITPGNRRWGIYASFEEAEAVNFIPGKPQVYKNTKKNQRAACEHKPLLSTKAQSSPLENGALRGAEPQEMLSILHSFIVHSPANIEHSAGAAGHGSSPPHTPGWGQLLKESARKWQKGLCSSHIQTNQSHSLQPLSPGSDFLNSSSLWQLLIFPVLCHSLMELQQGHTLHLVSEPTNQHTSPKQENNNSLFKENTRAAKLGEYFPYSHSSPLAIIVFHVLQEPKETELLIYKNYCTTFLQDLSPTTTKHHMSESLNDIALMWFCFYAG